jgi:hypothetical protein
MPHKFVPINYVAGSDIVVIGSNPESADMVNPRGEIFGYLPYVRAEDAYGNTKIKYSNVTHHVSVGQRFAEAEAEALAKRLNARLMLRRMPDFSQWQDCRPVYGSPAYEEYGQADDLAWEKAGHDEAY